MSIHYIKASDLKADSHNSVILDVRTPTEHFAKRLEHEHIHVPLDNLDPYVFLSQHALSEEKNIYVVCRSGARAARAAQQFIDAGFANVLVVEGGILACEECGHSIISSENSGGSALSIERQVRIGAGALVVLGALLGLFCNTAFILLSFFVGCGLIFAGITDWCGMGLLLMKAPWNQVRLHAETSCSTAKKQKQNSKKSNET